MRYALLLVALLLIFVPTGSALQPGKATIRIQQTRLSVARSGPERVGSTLVRTHHLRNRSLRGNPVFGNSILFCTYLGKGGVKGSGAYWCQANYALPKGTLVATGVVRNFTFYQLVVGGGTGFYSNAFGSLVVSAISLREDNLIFSLNAV